MAATTNTAPGLTQPTMIGMQAGNPKDSAIASQNQMNQKQASLSAAVGGRRKNKKGGDIAVPQFQMQYTPQGGDGQDPNALIQQNSQTSTQSVQNASMDSNALVKGGKKNRKGGNSDWSWGCSSGGKARSKRSKRSRRSRQNKRMKTKKNRKTKRTRK